MKPRLIAILAVALWPGTRSMSANDVEPVSFVREVLPILTQAGCNSGACHGASRGKDGFRLSLFGYDPEGDHFRITQEFPGRRINFGAPDRSLFLRKAIGDVVHTGGSPLEKEDTAYATLRAWIADGAPMDPKPYPQLAALTVEPQRLPLEIGNDRAQTVVEARFGDGSRYDVTHLTKFESVDPTIASVSRDGAVVPLRKGETFIMARYGDITEGASVLVSDPAEARIPLPEARTEIDRLVFEKQEAMKMAPGAEVDANAFLRRSALAIAGRLPTAEEIRNFLGSPDTPQHRDDWIDTLLGSDEYVDLWTLKWAELLGLRSENQVSYKGLSGFHRWIQRHVAQDASIAAMTQALITATGGSFENPPATYFQLEPNPRRLAEDVAQVFLGVRIQCAQCHNHPFDQWTIEDYHGFTGFLTQVGYKPSHDPRELVVYNKGVGEAESPISGQPLAPRYLGGGEAKEDSVDRRALLANWITADDNPFFARNIANRVWGQLMGRGIVEPVDDFRVSNPPSHPELLDYLADRLRAADYRLKPLIREIASSRVFQLTSEAAYPGDDGRYYTRFTPRRLRAETLLDAITDVTEAPETFPRMAAGARASAIVDGAISNYFLETFGRSDREAVCACASETEPTLSQALHLINGATVDQKINDSPVVETLLASGLSMEAAIRELYLRAFSREPSEDERAQLLAEIQTTVDPETGLKDVFWSLLNSKEFSFNH